MNGNGTPILGQFCLNSGILALGMAHAIRCGVNAEKPTKSGVAAALASLGYMSTVNDTPPALRNVPLAQTFTAEEMAFAKYLIWDTDFGGAWNDAEQINMHCQ